MHSLQFKWERISRKHYCEASVGGTRRDPLTWALQEGKSGVLTPLQASPLRPSSPVVLSSAAVGSGEEGEGPNRRTVSPGCVCVEAQPLLRHPPHAWLRAGPGTTAVSGSGPVGGGQHRMAGSPTERGRGC